jgi:hypothetical protein
MFSRTSVIALLFALILFGGLAFAPVAEATPAAQTFIQNDNDLNPEVAVMPEALGRISWGAIIAGAIVAIILQVALNLLGIGVGIDSINPGYGEESASAKSLGIGAAVWVGLTVLISLFIGGWISARFAGIPSNVDGLLHGLVTWGVVTLVGLFLLSTTVGRILNGLTRMMSQTMGLATRTAAGVAHQAGVVAQGAMHQAGVAASNVAGSAANAAQDAAQQAQHAAANNPDVPNMSLQTIRDEAMNLMRQAGLPQERVQGEAQAAMQDVRQTAQQVASNPAEAGRLLSEALDRLFQRGQNMASEANREDVLTIMMQRGNMSREQAEQTLGRWEHMASQTQQQAAQQVQQVQQKVEDVRMQAERKIDEIRHDVERGARETAQVATDAIARLALAAFAAIVVGAIAAGLGGLIGTPETLPVAEIQTTFDPNQANDTAVDGTVNDAVTAQP